MVKRESRLTSSALPESSGTLFLVDFEHGVNDTFVLGLSLALSDLNSRFDDVRRRAEASCWYTGYETGYEQGAWTVVTVFVGELLLGVAVGWEIDHRKGYVSQQTRSNTLEKSGSIHLKSS